MTSRPVPDVPYLTINTDIAQVIRRLMVFPNTALLTSSCGTGKTNINLGAIVQVNRRNLRLWEQKGTTTPEASKFRPSLILCPAGLVTSTYGEIKKGFSGDLIPHIYYGSSATYQGRGMAERAFVSREEFPNMLEELHEDDPKSAKHVFISSYFTFTRRNVEAIEKNAPGLNSDGRSVLEPDIDDDVMREYTNGDSIARYEKPGISDRGTCWEWTDEETEIERQLAMELDMDSRDDRDVVSHNHYEDADSVKWTAATEQNRKRKRPLNTHNVYSTTFNKRFNVLVLDEAHLIKNRNSNLHKMVKAIQREYLILCTATPMMNNPMDVLSYATMAWPNAQCHPLPRDFSFGSFYGPAATFLNYQPQDDPRERFIKDTKRLDAELASAYGKECDEIIRRHVVKEPTLDGTRQPLVDESKLTKEQYDNIRRWGARPWLINPIHFYLACREFNAKGSFDACRRVVREMLSALMVKRGMQTKLTLPDGTIVTPGDSLLGARFRIVDVHLDAKQQALYDGLRFRWNSDLYDDGRRDVGEAGADKRRLATDSQQRGRVRRANPAAFRHMLLPAFNLNNRKLLEPSKDTTALVNMLGIGTGKSRMTLGANSSRTVRATDNGEETGRITMGVHHSQMLATHTADGGAQWLFEALKAGPEYMMPNNRFEFVYWLAYHSPIMCRLLIQVREWIEEPQEHDLPNRVVIMAAMPWVQQDIALCLKMYGWNVSSIRADITLSERSRIIEDFNNPSTAIDVLLTSMDLSAFGLNLHGACNKGIVVQWPWSANYLLQVLGRLPRIGQRRHVEWIIYTMPGTLYDNMQSIIWAKYTRQLAVESRIHEDVCGVLADIAAYTLIFNLFSMPYHRWLWDRNVSNLNECYKDHGKAQEISVFFRYIGDMATDSVPKRHSKDFVAFSSLRGKSKEDFLAGAVGWLKGNKPKLSWTWLARNCSTRQIKRDFQQSWLEEHIGETLTTTLMKKV
ncbi:P-loop containing nucleoside triphosphate hydrolase protein [Hypomontagnella monticulosa]|nr:P-loop containing nucleoside triphosphate hydrolase protein [Hypomontagnella monticulosa]